jgi:hypothetical protein
VTVYRGEVVDRFRQQLTVLAGKQYLDFILSVLRKRADDQPTFCGFRSGADYEVRPLHFGHKRASTP